MKSSIWAVAVMLAIIGSADAGVNRAFLSSPSLASQETQLRQPLLRESEFSTIPHVSSRPNCEEVQPPEALMTPDPLWNPNHERPRVQVSFIIGTDGRVHAPLILESAGISGDRRVIQTVKSWRFRPATCNGVPTETEGKVSFSTR